MPYIYLKLTGFDARTIPYMTPAGELGFPAQV